MPQYWLNTPKDKADDTLHLYFLGQYCMDVFMSVYVYICTSYLSGFFAYTCGCVVVIENLKSGEQTHLMGHVEEISTLAVQSDCLVCVPIV